MAIRSPNIIEEGLVGYCPRIGRASRYNITIFAPRITLLIDATSVTIGIWSSRAQDQMNSYVPTGVALNYTACIFANNQCKLDSRQLEAQSSSSWSLLGRIGSRRESDKRQLIGSRYNI